MARIRSIKPLFFQHERLFELGNETKFGPLIRIAWAGLWTQADCRGLFEWRPLRLKLAILPWDDVDFAALLEAFEREGMVVRYESDGKKYGWIRAFSKHQRPTKHEIDKGPQHPEPMQLEEYASIYVKNDADGAGSCSDTSPGTFPGTSSGTSPGTFSGKCPGRSESGVLSPEYGVLSSEGERAGARDPGAAAPEPPPPSSPSASPEPEAEAERRMNTPEGVRRQWNRAAAILGMVPGKCSPKDLRACLELCPDPLDREMSFELAFCESEPPAFNFFVADLATWVARARKDAADNNDDLDRRRASMIAADLATAEPSKPPTPSPPPKSIGEIIGGIGGEKRRQKSAEEQKAELRRLEIEERKRA